MIPNLFGGPGGWEEALRRWPDLYAQAVGIEWDRWACATRAAAGHRTIRADVGDVDLRRWMRLDILGLTGSPPCPTFSNAGDGSAMADVARLIEAAHTGRMIYDTADPRTALVLEPARWTRWLRPRWVALEQVPQALPVWEATAHYLRTLGYATWCGVLNAADYGVPQTRRRAILLASLDLQPHRPPPTHQRPPVGMFDHPWVTMADALGWPGGITLDRRQNGAPIVTTDDRPAPTVTAGAIGHGVWQLHAGGRPNRDRRPINRTLDQPAPTILANFVKDGRWAWQDSEGRFVRQLTLEEGLALQSFPVGYPLQGGKQARGRQVGDAMPPRLAAHVLAAAMGTEVPAPHGG